MMRQADVHRGVVVARAPVAGKRGIEHLAEPVDDHRLLHLAEDTVVDAGVVGGAAAALARARLAIRMMRPPSGFDRGHLLLIGGDDIVDGRAGGGIEVVGAGAGGNEGAGTLALPASSERAISSRAAGQSRPMPRWAVSMASATARPRSQRYSRKAMVRSQSIAVSSQGSLAASASATTCAAEKATRLKVALALPG